MSTLTGGDLNLVKPALTDDHKVTIGTDLPANFQKIDDEFSTHLAETTPHAELVDRTITVGVGKDFETIQGAIDSIKKNVQANIIVHVDAGTYAEDVKIEGFAGAGFIWLKGAEQLTDSENYKIKSLAINNCTCRIYVHGLESTTADANNFAIRNSTEVAFYYCLSTVSSSHAGFRVDYSTGLISDSQVSNHAYALHVDIGGMVQSQTWTAGSGNTVGLYTAAGIITKYSTQPQGTTTEQAVSGGVIR